MAPVSEMMRTVEIIGAIVLIVAYGFGVVRLVQRGFIERRIQLRGGGTLRGGSAVGCAVVCLALLAALGYGLARHWLHG